MTEPAKDGAAMIQQVAKTVCCSSCVGRNSKYCNIETYVRLLEECLAEIHKAGWAVVPIDPTTPMLRAVNKIPRNELDWVDGYRIMIAVALAGKP